MASVVSLILSLTQILRASFWQFEVLDEIWYIKIIVRRSEVSSSTATEKVIHLVYHDKSCGIMSGKYVMERGKYTESAWKACYHMGRLLFRVGS